MRKILFKILMRFLEQPSYHILSREEVSSLLTRLAKDEDYDRFPDFLQQCADQFKNQYLYSGQEMFKGSVLAFTQLREQLLEKRKPQKKKSLTSEDEGGIIKPPIY